MEVAQVNLPVGLLIWVMIIPMLLKVDFGALHEVRSTGAASASRCSSTGLVKPFSMALLGWIFIRHLFAPYLPADQLDSYIAGLILLAAAPCTAMVFVWSRLTNGDPLFTLSQVALNDTIMVFAFAPIVALLLGMSAITVPWDTLLTSVVLYIVIPVALAQLWRKALLRRGQAPSTRTMAEDRPVVDHRAAGHAGAAVRLPGRGHPAAAAGHRAAGGADPDPGVLQLGAGLLAQPRSAKSTTSPAPRR
jgi:ACR3 family arsenite transporter